jgi:hypothetical protein
MKKVIIVVFILMATFSVTTYAHSEHSKKHKKHAATTRYTCTMHPEIIRNKPGKCPTCGMKLVPMKEKKEK